MAKTTKEKIEIMQAYERGEQIQMSEHDKNEWTDMKIEPLWDWMTSDYRIKSKSTYVPFDTAEEFLDAQRKHGSYVFVIGRGRHYAAYINANCHVNLVGNGKKSYVASFKGFLEKCNFEDGTPCGKEVAL